MPPAPSPPSPSPPPPSLPSRLRGSLYGLAACDALGSPVEFHRRGTFPPLSTFLPNPNFDLPAGAWTDDTSMMLCLAQSLVDTRGKFDAEDQVRKYVKWFRAGYMSSVGRCFDVGNATRVALGIWEGVLKGGEKGEKGGEKGGEGGEEMEMEKGQRLVDRGLGHKRQCGNGSLMRVVPIPLVYHRNPALALQNALLSSQVTHPYPTNTEACQIYTQLVILALSPTTSSKANLAQALINYPFTCDVLRERFAKYTADLASFALVPEAEIQSSGYVVATLEAALWSFFTTSGFREGALKAVNLGDDADTVGAVYGGLAGAFYGVEDVPVEWMDGLMRKDLVDEVVEGVVRLVQESEASDNGEKNPSLQSSSH